MSGQRGAAAINSAPACSIFVCYANGPSPALDSRRPGGNRDAADYSARAEASQLISMTMQSSVTWFVRRFFIHVLPDGFHPRGKHKACASQDMTKSQPAQR